MSVKVNCWYCSEDSLVSARCRDSWECPKCDQFNSFTADGDVTPSAAAAGAQPRPVRYNVAVQPAAAVAARWQLCHRCNLQQQLKTHQLAEFRPVVEQHWETELEDYRRHLERVYQPCTHCQAVVASALREADDRVRPAWLAWKRQRQPAAGGGEPGVSGLAVKLIPVRSTRLGRWGTAVRAAALKTFTAIHGGAVTLCGACGVGLNLVLLACPLILLLLLSNSYLIGLRRDLAPGQYRSVLLEADDLFAENKAALVLLCFTLWIFTRPGLSVQAFVGLSLWSTICAAEMLVGQYIAASTAGLLQAALVSGLWLLWIKTAYGRQAAAAGRSNSVPSLVKDPAPSSSTPRTSPNGTAGSHANGHVPAAASASSPTSGGLPSPIAARPPSPSPQQADYDYNLPRLSLGSPRKQAGSGGVFTLKTYRPASGAALFSGGSGEGGGRPTPLLSPSRLRSELHHSAWIAGGYWQRGQPALPSSAATQQLMSRSSSQSSGFVDACGPSFAAGPVPPPAGSVLGEDDPGGWAGSQCDARSCAGDMWTHAPSCLGSQRSSAWRSCSGEWRRRVGPEPEGRDCGPAAALHDSGSLLSDRSLTSQRTAASAMTEVGVSHRSLLVALVLGFSMAFNIFALLLLVYRDRL